MLKTPNPFARKFGCQHNPSRLSVETADVDINSAGVHAVFTLIRIKDRQAVVMRTISGLDDVEPNDGIKNADRVFEPSLCRPMLEKVSQTTSVHLCGPSEAFFIFDFPNAHSSSLLYESLLFDLRLGVNDAQGELTVNVIAETWNEVCCRPSRRS